MCYNQVWMLLFSVWYGVWIFHYEQKLHAIIIYLYYVIVVFFSFYLYFLRWPCTMYKNMRVHTFRQCVSVFIISLKLNIECAIKYICRNKGKWNKNKKEIKDKSSLAPNKRRFSEHAIETAGANKWNCLMETRIYMWIIYFIQIVCYIDK